MDSEAVSRWCDARRETYAARGADRWIEIADPRNLRMAERDAIASQCARFNLALYRFARDRNDPDALSAFASAMGLERRDATLGADHRGIARVRVVRHTRGAEMIPFTLRALNWHTDGYYNASHQAVHGVVMHCASPAASGGETTLLDPDLVYAAIHEQSPALVEALAHPCAMTIPAHEAEGVVVRPARTGPVFRFLDNPPRAAHALHDAHPIDPVASDHGHRPRRRRARRDHRVAHGGSGTRSVRGRPGRDLQQRAAPPLGVRRWRGRRRSPSDAEDSFVRSGRERVGGNPRAACIRRLGVHAVAAHSPDRIRPRDRSRRDEHRCRGRIRFVRLPGPVEERCAANRPGR